jgi:hypothetical protein
MTTRTVVAAALVVPALVVVTSIAPRWATLRSAIQGDQLAQPANWVPFSATSRFTYPSGSVAHGRFYRSSDGSERLDKEAYSGQPATTTIKNIPTSTYYMAMGEPTCCDRWASYPMKLPREGYTPSYIHPLSASAVEKVEGTWSGFDAYRLARHNNFTRYLVPALNYFAVFTVDPTGARREFLDIRVGEQPSALFEPPAGAVVERVNRYNGIIDTEGDEVPGSPAPRSK